MRAAVAAGLSVLLATAAAAQPAPPSGSPPTEVPPVAQQCVACHRGRGQGNPAAGFPRIAAQPEYYLAKQLRDYASGRRRHPVMESMARALSEQDITTLATFFSRQEAPATPAPRGPERGRVLAAMGDARRQVQGCANCHGPDGGGQPPAIPYLAGLDARYLASAIDAWKSGARRNDGGGQMLTVARALSAEDIAAVTAHYAGLKPPAPPPSGLVRLVRPRLSGGPAPMASQSAGAAIAGAEQGATSGGATHGRGASGPETRVPPEGGPAPVEAGEPSVVAAPSRPPTVGDPARGRAIVASGRYGCVACHSIPGIRGANGVVGPPLGRMAERGFIAGQLPNRRDVLAAFLLDPPALVPSTGMPDTGLSREEALHIAAYLYTLER
ncbi:MAG TPA: c-type cytochrome [Gemmatimonadaceae bacterium]|nr:c-type cytochrome [Gemmatimonadaceae bacterium]